MDSVFVEIASYRDVELPRTIENALDKAQYPDRISFGICWQYDERTFMDLEHCIGNPRIRIDTVYYEHSKGCCWARHRTNLLYRDEAYVLQIDAHSRFAEDWESRFIEMLESLPAAKPILSTYPPPFEYINGKEQLNHDCGVQRLIMNRMRRDLTTIYRSEPVDDLSKPVPSQFIAAGQIFAHGGFVRDVPYDPELYFGGEEISLAARAYTHGYDFFCPNETLVWHYYQHSMPHHWADHDKNQERNTEPRLLQLFIEDHRQLGPYGLGAERSLAEFEDYAEISFKERRDRKPAKCHFQQTMDLSIPEIEDRSDYEMWIFTLRNIDDEEIYRQDLYDPEILSKQQTELEVDEHLEDEPVSYMLWPKTKDEFLEQHFRDLG